MGTTRAPPPPLLIVLIKNTSVHSLLTALSHLNALDCLWILCRVFSVVLWMAFGVKQRSSSGHICTPTFHRLSSAASASRTDVLCQKSCCKPSELCNNTNHKLDRNWNFGPGARQKSVLIITNEPHAHNSVTSTKANTSNPFVTRPFLPFLPCQLFLLDEIFKKPKMPLKLSSPPPPTGNSP